MYVDVGYIAFSGECVSLMAADTDQELHTMAGRVGLPKAIFSAGRSHVYFVNRDARDKAIAMGATLVDRKEILAKLRRP